MWNLLKSRLHPFSHRSFRLFFFAQGLSLIGTWSHELARAWLVLQISNTATALGTLLLCTALPGFFLTFHGGNLADRVDCRKLVIFTKGTLALSAFTFFIVSEFMKVQLWMIFVFGVLEGLMNSYDGPAFTSLFSRIMPKEDFRQSLSLQSLSFHLSRTLGPSIAGLIMMWKGPSFVFLFDSLSYLGVIVLMFKLPLREKILVSKNAASKGWAAISDGIRYFFQDPTKRYKQFQLLLSITTIVPLMTLVFRTYLKSKFDLNPAEFGYLFSFPALGAISGAFYFTFFPKEKPIRHLRIAIPALVVAVLIVIVAPNAHLAALSMSVGGFFMYLNIASITQSLQIETADDYRGRLGSIITLLFNSIGPLMGYPIGMYADFVGYEKSILHITLFFFILSAYLAYANFIKTSRRRNPA